MGYRGTVALSPKLDIVPLNMNIVLITSVAGNGGSAATAFHNTRVLQQKGATATLFAPGTYWLEKGQAEDVPVNNSLSLKRGFRPLSFLADFFRLRRFLVREKVDAVLVQKSPEQWLAFFVLKTIRRPIVFGRLRGVVFPIKPSGFNRWIHNSMHVILCSASCIVKRFADLPGFNQDHVKLLLEGIDTEHHKPPTDEERSEARRAMKLKPDAFYIGTAGRPAPVKGHDILVRAFAKACKGKTVDGRPVRLAIFSDESRRGPGSYTDLGALCNQLGIWECTDLRPDFIFDTRQIYRALNVYALPSRGSEGSSRAALEARATGLPLIASSVGVLPDLIQDGVNGKLVPPEDVDKLADAFNTVIASWDSAKLWGAEARQTTEKDFRESDYAGKLIRFLENTKS